MTVTDDDEPEVTVSSDTLGVNEGGSGSYTVRLAFQPTESVTIDVTGGGDVTVQPASLTFTADTWETPQTVTVRAAEDTDTADDAQTVTHAVDSDSAPEYVGLSIDSVTVTVTDDDDPGVTVSKDTLSVVEGGSETYTVRLAFQPTASVTIDVTGGGDVTAQPPSLTFTADTWETPQTVTVTAAEDLDTADDTQTITHAVDSNSAPEYVGLSIDSVAVTVTDNDVPGVSVSRPTLSVNEGGSETYTVRLTLQPTTSVTIDVTGGGDVTVEPPSLTFTADTWETPQTVTVRAAEDTDTADDAQTITHAVTGNSAPEYVGLSIDSVAVTVTDNDEPDVTVSRDTLSVVEGSTATYTVALDAQPTTSVTIDVTGGGDVTVNPTSLTFTADNWDDARTVTVRAAEDLDTADDAQTITHAVTGNSAPEYVGLSIDSVAVTVNDNDDPDVTVSRSTLSIVEGGTATYTVALDSQPTTGVTIDVTGGGDVTVQPASLTFTADNWDDARTVTVRAAEDTDTANDAQTITHAVTGNSAPEYVGLSIDSVAVTVTDNDDPDVTVRFEYGAYSLAEGSSVTVRVRLSEDPKRTVTIPLTGANQGGASSADYSGVPAGVTFQSGDTEQSFTFGAAEDTVDDDGESVKLGFGPLPVMVMAGTTSEATLSIADVGQVGDNRPPTVSARAEPLTVYPGDDVTLRGAASDPDGDALTHLWTSDGGGIFAPAATELQGAWVAPATERAYTANLTLAATDERGLSSSVTVSVLVEPFPRPNAATDLRGTVSDDNSVSLTWTIPGQPRDVTIEDVQVQQRSGDGRFEAPTWDTVDTLAGTGTHTTVSGLAADTEYFFRVRLTSNHDLTADSRPLIVRTPEGAPAPRHFAAQWPTQTSITLNWSTVETAAEYKLDYRKDGETGWTRIVGDFDHLPSTSDHRQAFGVAAGLDCESDYDFRVSVRGSGDARNDGDRYPSGSFGSYAETSARTGECAQEERITNLLVSTEPDCATLTWTPPSGGRDTGYRVQRYGSAGHETLVDQANSIADRYEDCSAAYRTDGARHSYIVTALDNDPGRDEEGAYGSAYTSSLVYGPGWEPEGPGNVRLTSDTRFIRELAWDAPWDLWLSTVKTARAGSGPQQVVADPWVTGYRVERREYRRTEDGGWYLPEVEEEAIWSATMTVGSSTTGSPATGYFGTGSGALGAMTQTTITYPVGSGSWTVTGLFATAAGLQLRVNEGLPLTESLSHSAFKKWVLVVDGRSFPFDLPEGIVGQGLLALEWPDPGLNWTDGQEVSVRLVESIDWETLRDETDGDTATSFTDSEDKGDRQYVYRVRAYNAVGLNLYSSRDDWAFNGGDPGGYPEEAPQPEFGQSPQQEGETPSNTPATGAPAIGGTPQVRETLTASTSGIVDADGLDDDSYRYQWIAGGSDIDGATGSTYTLTSSEQGQTIQVRVTFTDDAGNAKSLTSAATAQVEARPNTPATGLPTISGTPQVEETLTADTSPIDDQDGLTNASYRYQWTAGGTDIDGATGSSYELTSSEQGQTIKVRVTFTDDRDNEETLTSEATVAVAAAANRGATGQPTISGTPQVGQTLTADTSAIADEDGLDDVSYSYQWIAGGTDIDGATGSSYELTSSEQGQTIKVRVTFTDDRDNEETLTSEATVAVAAAANRGATGQPTISGTPQVGQTLTADLSHRRRGRAGPTFPTATSGSPAVRT